MRKLFLLLCVSMVSFAVVQAQETNKETATKQVQTLEKDVNTNMSADQEKTPVDNAVKKSCAGKGEAKACCASAAKSGKSCCSGSSSSVKGKACAKSSASSGKGCAKSSASSAKAGKNMVKPTSTETLPDGL